MPTLTLQLALGPRLALDLELDQHRARAPQATLTRSAFLAALILAELRRQQTERAEALVPVLRLHPRRAGAGLPIPLQDHVLGLIAAGFAHLIPELVRAGEWEQQIAAIARRWQQDGLAHEELCSAGKVGLLRAISGWRPGPGWRSYAYLWIKKEIERACRTGGALVMESEQEMRIRRAAERGARRGLDVAGIAKKTGLSEAQVRRGLEGRRALGWKEIDPRRM